MCPRQITQAGMPDQSPLAPSGRHRVDPTRFDAVVVPEIDILYRVARSITGNSDDAEDLLQETLLRAFRGMEAFDGHHGRAWLLTIMRNANINSHRRQRPVLLRYAADRVDGPDARSPRAPSAEEVASASWVDERIDEAVGQLSPRLRQTIQLVDIDGLTYDEAAGVLDVPTGTVVSRLHRARRRVSDRLVHHNDLGEKTP